MGKCESYPCAQTSNHPLLGSVEEVKLTNRNLIKIVDFNITELKLKQWEKDLKELDLKNPNLLDVIFRPLFYNTTSTCALNTRIQFYFQNYHHNLMLEKEEKQRKGLRFTQERIKEIGKFLFEFWERNPELDQKLTLENILLNQSGKMKIALRRYLPIGRKIQYESNFDWSKITKLSEETDYQTSPRFSVFNQNAKKKNLLKNICKILLNLIKDDVRYSSSFTSIIHELRRVDRNEQVLQAYFLDRVRKSPKNYFLDVSYIEEMNDKSNDTSLFLVTESGWTDFHNNFS